jgi:hypothetical protein
MGPVVLETDKDLSNKFVGQVELMFIIYPNTLKYISFINELLDFINRHSFKSPNGIRKTWRRCRPFSSELTAIVIQLRFLSAYFIELLLISIDQMACFVLNLLEQEK